MHEALVPAPHNETASLEAAQLRDINGNAIIEDNLRIHIQVQPSEMGSNPPVAGEEVDTLIACCQMLQNQQQHWRS